jgi:hypothetical protein
MRLVISSVLLVVVLAMAAPAMPAAACGECEAPGVGTPGYWMNHPEAWPVDGLTIGGIDYTKDQVIAIMKAPGKGDKTYDMFSALVAAVLNKLVYNPHDCIYNELGAAEYWLRAHPLGSNVRGNSQLWQGGHGEIVFLTLDAYNNGWLCAPPRES